MLDFLLNYLHYYKEYLHQNLLEVIRNTVNAMIPADIRIPKDYIEKDTTEDTCKKNGLRCG